LKILIVTPVIKGGCEYHRILVPYYKLAETYPDITIKVVNVPFDIALIRHFDVMVGHYQSVDKEVIMLAKRLGVKVVIDIDDYFNIPPNHLLYRLYQQEKRFVYLPERLKLADMVTTTTVHLANKIRSLNPNTVVTENALDTQALKNVPFILQNEALYDKFVSHNVTHETAPIIFGYVGGDCHLPDIEQLIGLPHKCASEFGDKMRFNLYGYNGRPVYDSYIKILTGLSKHLDLLRVYHQLSVDEYMWFYNMHHVSLAPLHKNFFAEYKSPLKIIESGFFRRPIICSNCKPYNNLLIDKKHGFLCDNVGDWFKAIKTLVNNPNMIMDMGEALYEFVSNRFDVEVINKKRYNYLKKLTDGIN
jgi:glycosyltransferase involved in cell wall biosynthesis